MSWFRRFFHKHVWVDQFEFDSCFEMTTTGETRVLARAMMTRCEVCGQNRRRPMPLSALAK